MTQSNKTVAFQAIRPVRNVCTAFSWDSDGHCRGIRLECDSSSFRIAAVWQADCDKNSGLAETLSQGRKSLAVNDTSYCVAAPVGGGWGMVDLTLPPLKGVELQAALAFELRKRTPVPAEQLEWGYRLLDAPQGQDKRVRLRLFYVRKEAWRKWQAAATGLSRLDILVPAPVALDPLFAEAVVVFPGKTAFQYVPGPDGRDAVPCEMKEGACLRQLLPFEGLDLGELASLPEQEQTAFVQPIVLAAYGLTRNLSQDSRTLPALPPELRPKRYQAFRLLTSLLCAFIVICLSYGLMQGFQLRKTRLRLIKKDISIVEAEMRTIQAASKGKLGEAVKMLEEEMARYKIDAPALSDVLIELTSLIEPPGWLAGPFTWSMDISDSVVPVTFVLREPMDSTANLDIATKLNNSPILGDVVENKSAANRAGFSERRFVLKARYDTPEEKAALMEYMKKKREEDAKAAQIEDEAGDGVGASAEEVEEE